MRFLYFVLIGFALTLVNASAATLPGPVVSTQWLAQHRNDVLILDVRHDVKSFTKKPVYVKDKKTHKLKLVKVGGHIPGAVLVNYKKVREDRMINGKKVQYLIPTKKDFEALMRSAGLNNNSTVVIASKGENNLEMTMATRLYWQLKYYGFDNMAILNGGVAQWLTDKHKVSVASSKPAKGSWKATAERKELLASSQDVQDAINSKSTQLMDTRPVSQYWGTFKKSYVYADGHIQGAVNFPNALMTRATKPARFLSKDEYQKLFKAIGVNEHEKTITYCNSGHLASGGWFIMSELVGNKNARLYDGSMHEWTLEKHPVVAYKK